MKSLNNYISEKLIINKNYTEEKSILESKYLFCIRFAFFENPKIEFSIIKKDKIKQYSSDYCISGTDVITHSGTEGEFNINNNENMFYLIYDGGTYYEVVIFVNPFQSEILKNKIIDLLNCPYSHILTMKGVFEILKFNEQDYKELVKKMKPEYFTDEKYVIIRERSVYRKKLVDFINNEKS